MIIMYIRINQVYLSATRDLNLGQSPRSVLAKKGRRGIRVPSRASTRRPSIKEMPLIERTKMPKMKTPNIMTIRPREREIPVAAQVN
jgi:hypothetical protein